MATRRRAAAPEAKTVAHASSADDEVARTAIALFMKEPFFAHVLQGLLRRTSDDIPTAAVCLRTSGVELVVNGTYFATLTPEERVAVLKHEVLHVVFKHLLRAIGRQPLLWNLACDVVVNELVPPFRLPEGAITRRTFPDLGLEPDMTADDVYQRLVGLLRELDDARGGGNGGTGGGTAGDSGGASGESDGDGDGDGEGTSEDGSCGPNATYANSGQPSGTNANTPPAEDENVVERAANATSAPKSARALARLQGNTDAPGGHSDHRGWGGRPGAEQGADGHSAGVEAGIDGLVVRAAERVPAKHWGSVPGAVRAAVEQARERTKPRVDWKRVLRLFAARSGRTKVIGTQRRESARYGTFPGTKIKRFHALAVAIDTSGSIHDDVLRVFFDEIDAIWRSGSRVHVVLCDAAVHGSFEWRGRAPASLGGGGGTAFDPVFQWLHEHRSLRVDGCVYLTDGVGPAPDVKPPCPLLWVVTQEPDGLEQLKYGRRIRIDVGV